MGTSSDNAILVSQFRHNVWANDEMLRACSGLTDEQLATELTGTYGRLDRTIIHLARAQGGYLIRLTGWEPAPEHDLDYDAPFPGVEHVRWHLRMTGEALIEVAARISPEQVPQHIDDLNPPKRIPAWGVLLQAAYHATEHRQQIATALTHLGVEPPEPDYWAFCDPDRSSGAASSPPW